MDIIGLKNETLEIGNYFLDSHMILKYVATAIIRKYR